MDTIKKTVWVAVDDNFEFSEHDSMEAAVATTPYVLFLEQEGTWRNGGYNNYAYNAELYNKEGLKVDGVAMNNWRLSELAICRDGFYIQSIRFSIIDPWGLTKERYFGNSRPGIISAFVFLRAASKYYSWSEYYQEDPVEKERTAIYLLEQKVEELKVENERLKSKMEAIQEILTREPTEVE